MKKILIIDDDVHIGDMLEEVLIREGYGVVRAYSGTEAELLLASASALPDMILLDLMLPGIPGEALLPRICDIPTIVISAKTDIEGKIHLLQNGAVDYMTKPFEIRELLARIEIALRCHTVSSRLLKFDDILLDAEQHTVSVDGREVRLTRTEYAILKLLMQNSSQVVSKSHLLDSLFEDTPDCTEASLKIHVSNLRKKLRAVSGRDYIEAVWGIGFRLRTE